jgi:hypothetical protein
MAVCTLRMLLVEALYHKYNEIFHTHVKPLYMNTCVLESFLLNGLLAYLTQKILSIFLCLQSSCEIVQESCTSRFWTKYMQDSLRMYKILKVS